MSLAGDVMKAVSLAAEGGFADGGHHKQWYLDQILRVLLADGYAAWRKDIEVDEECGDWDEGVAP